MPLRCVDEHGAAIEANACDEGQWKALRARNRAERNLKMPCCPARAVLKTSRRGTRFFAHKARGGCAWKPETEVHLHLKKLALLAARGAGWDAETEVSGSTPDGERWTADVLARRGRHKVAVEIQWSGQTNEETARRQERYARSGVRGVWLLRQPDFPISKDLPAACIGGSLEEGLKILIPKWDSERKARSRKTNHHWTQDLAPEDFFKAVFEYRFRFATEHLKSVTLSVITGVTICLECGVPTRIVTGFAGPAGTVDLEYDLELARANPDLAERLQNAVKDRNDIGRIRERYGRKSQLTYLMNACARCDARIGRFFERPRSDCENVAEIEYPFNAQMKDLIASRSQRWLVWDAARGAVAPSNAGANMRAQARPQ